jgi:hypothetical protein
MTLTVHVNVASSDGVGHRVTEGGIVERWMLHDPDLPVNRVNRSGTLVVLDTQAAARLPYQDR